MKNEINLLPQKTRDDVKRERTTFYVDLVSAIVLIVVELSSFVLILLSQGLQKKVDAAKVSYQKNQVTINSFSKVNNLINNINYRYSNIVAIQKTFYNPIDVFHKLKLVTPSNISIYDINYDYNGNISYYAQAPDVLSVAKYMFIMTENNSQNKYFNNTQISSLSISSGSITFNVTTDYNGN